jgi:CMP-N,N'-diacetyllegionaminic acid synthase
MANKKKILCFIPARKRSHRLINKNLKKINGKSLVEITILQAIKSKIFEDIILSSDSKKILRVGKKFNITCFQRSKKNSNNKSTTDSALLETLSKYNGEYDYIVLLQVTSPLRKLSTIKSFINFCLKNKIQNCLTVNEINDNVSYPNKSYFLPLKKKRQRTQDKKPYLIENGLIYFFSKYEFLKHKRIFSGKKWNIFVTNKYESIDINSKNDYMVCKKLSQKK